jgi:hypothetical protein
VSQDDDGGLVVHKPGEVLEVGVILCAWWFGRALALARAVIG